MMAQKTVKDTALRRFTKNPAAMTALIVLALITIACLSAPLWPHFGEKSNLDARWLPPRAEHWLGTDEQGKDYFTRVLDGGRITLFVGFVATLVSMTVGVLVGVCAAYFGRFVDEALMRLVDLLTAVPWMVLVIVARAFFPPGLWTIILIIGALSWMSTARLVRAEALSIKERTFVGYAKYIGEKPAVVIFRHILPGAIGTIIVVSTATVSGAIMTESALGFLGLGVPAPLASWGSLLSTSKGQLATAPHLAIVPGLLIAITVFCVNVIGNGLRSAIMREESR